MSFPEIAKFFADREVKYEMRCRGIRPEDFTIKGRIDWWKRQLAKEARDNVNPLEVKSYLPVAEDLKEANTWFSVLFEEADTEDSALLEKVGVRVNFLEQRIKRMEVEPDGDNAAMHDVLLKGIADLKSQIEKTQYEIWKGESSKKKGSKGALNSSAGGLAEGEDLNVTGEEANQGVSESTRRAHNRLTTFRVDSEGSDDEMSSSLLVSSVRRLDISSGASPKLYKWPIKFSGDNSHESASEFLQRVADFARSRRVSDIEVLESLADILDGSALRWYRRKRDTLTTYKAFVKKFLEEFEPLNRTEKLLDHIKERKQKVTESIVQYISLVENLFMRLSHPPPERERIKIIRKNLLPQYIRSLALFEFNSIEELERACKKLEDNESQARENATLGARYLSTSSTIRNSEQRSFNTGSNGARTNNRNTEGRNFGFNRNFNNAGQPDQRRNMFRYSLILRELIKRGTILMERGTKAAHCRMG